MQRDPMLRTVVTGQRTDEALGKIIRRQAICLLGNVSILKRNRNACPLRNISVMLSPFLPKLSERGHVLIG